MHCYKFKINVLTKVMIYLITFLTVNIYVTEHNSRSTRIERRAEYVTEQRVFF